MVSNNQEDIHKLCDCLIMLESRKEAYNFLKDLCTPNELNALAERWKLCTLLDQRNLSYRELSALTGSSLTLITRVARSLKDEPYQGYQTILKKIRRKEK